MVGALAYTMADTTLIQAISKGRCSPNDTETAIRELVAFTAAGLLNGAGVSARKSKDRK